MNHVMQLAESAVFGGGAGAILKAGYNDFLNWFLGLMIFVANLAGGVVIAVGTIRGFGTYVISAFRRKTDGGTDDHIRISLGKSLSLALEFQLGADILGTARDPSIRDLITLAAIILLRTVLNYFLGRELDATHKET